MLCSQIIRTENGSGYTSKTSQHFCSQWKIDHKTGIPYHPQGQGIVERAHSSLKAQLLKVRRGKLFPQSPQDALNHSLFILNILNVDACEQSAPDTASGTMELSDFLASQVERSTHQAMERAGSCPNMGSRACLCFLEGRK